MGCRDGEAMLLCRVGRCDDGGFGLVFDCEGAVAVADFAARNGGDAVAGDDGADEVERIGCGYGDEVGRFAGARGAEGLDGFGEGELLAAKTVDKATAADLAAGFEAAEDVEQIAPFGSVGLAGEEIAQEDSVAREEGAGVGLKGGVGAAGSGDGGLLECGGGTHLIPRYDGGRR